MESRYKRKEPDGGSGQVSKGEHIVGDGLAGRPRQEGDCGQDLSELMDMGESSFLDIPSLEDLLRDPLLEGDWQFLDQEYQSANEVSANYTGSTESANDTVMHFDESQGNRLDALSPDQSIKSHTAQLDNIAIDGAQSASRDVAREDTPDGSSPEEEEERQKRLKRMARNRESASLSRERKKMQTAEKDKQLAELQARLAGANAISSQLAQENAVLRQHIAGLCQQLNQPVPQILQTPQPMPMPYTYPSTNNHPQAGYVPMQKVPIQRLPVQRPAPAAPVARAPKRRKQQAVAGGTTAMAALFCFLFFWSPFSPQIQMPSQKGGPSVVASSRSSLQNQGRVLQSTDLIDDASSGWLAERNHTNDKLIQSSDLEVQDKTLQHLKAIGPVAVFSKYDTEAKHFKAPAPWKSLASLADSALARDGISKSLRCEKEFSVDVSTVKDPAAAQQQLQKYMTQTTNFRGRYQALALPPIGQKLPAALEIQDQESHHDKSSIGCEDKADDDYIISVMMPTKDQLDGYTALSKLYVVVLNPNKKYAAYSCGLDKPVLI